MKKSLKTLNIALACLMSVQVATIFAMEKEPNKSITSQVEKTPVSTIKTPIFKCLNFLFCWPKTTGTLKNIIMPCMMNHKKKLIVGAISAASFITSAILKNKKLTIWTGALTGFCAVCCLAKKFYDIKKNKYSTGNIDFLNTHMPYEKKSVKNNPPLALEPDNQDETLEEKVAISVPLAKKSKQVKFWLNEKGKNNDGEATFEEITEEGCRNEAESSMEEIPDLV